MSLQGTRYGFGGAVVQRTPPSALDIYTIVSIFPKPIREIKVTLDPGEWIIPAGSYEKPGVLTIGSSVSWIKYSAEMEAVELSFSAIQIAHSVITDYSAGLIAVRVGIAQPGLFYVEGRKTSEQVVKDHKTALDNAKKLQDTWYSSLVTAADSLWARSNGNPVAIPTDSRIAAEALGLKNKPWMQDFNTLQMVSCVNCGNLRNPNYPSCPSCRVVVDLALFKKLGLGANPEVK